MLLCYYWFIALLDGGRKACHFYVAYCQSVHKARLGCVLIMLAPPLQQSYLLLFLDISVKINMNIYFKTKLQFPSISTISTYSYTCLIKLHFLEVVFMFLIVW